MWILNTILAAFFASLTVIFTKLSVSKLNSTLITGLRTTIVLLLIFLINLFLALFVLIVSKITSNARFKMTFANSNLLFLAIFSIYNKQ